MPGGADVIVIGAGIAGCAAARALTAKGASVIVIEARDRIGGRIWSVDGFDHGAHWIHGTEGNPLTTLAHQWRLPLLFVGGDCSYVGGWDRLHFPAADAPDKDASIIAADRLFDALEEYRAKDALRSGGDQSLASAAAALCEKLAPDGMANSAAQWHLNLLTRDDCAADSRTFSLHGWDEGYEVHGYGDSVLPGGMQQLVERMSDGLDVRLNEVVTAIAYGDDGCRITSGSGEWHAGQVVVTVPLGVLKCGAIAFDPPLPTAKQDAIDRLGYGNLTKVRLLFDAPFWNPQQYAFGLYPPDGAPAPTIAVNQMLLGDAPGLIMPIGAPDGPWVERLDEDALHDWVMAVLRRNFGEDVPTPQSIERTHWASDPFARGTYSYAAVGSGAREFAAMAMPVGSRLHFAGEACSRHQWATMHGAYLSGLEVAATISGDPSLLPPLHFTENRRWRAQMLRANRFLNLRRGEIGEAEVRHRVALMEASPAFAHADWAELAMLATMFEQRTLEGGDVLCRAGDAADEVYLVADGALSVRRPDGAEIGRMEAGSLAGEYGMFGDSRRMAELAAAEPTTILVLDYARFRRFLLAFPQTALDLLGAGLGRLLQSSTENN